MVRQHRPDTGIHREDRRQFLQALLEQRFSGCVIASRLAIGPEQKHFPDTAVPDMVHPHFRFIDDLTAWSPRHICPLKQW